MKQDIHPKYDLVTVHCSCGNDFETRSTADSVSVELCSQCHPFYTGKQKLVDTGGRIERFERRFGRRKNAPTAPGMAELGADRDAKAASAAAPADADAAPAADADADAPADA